MTPIPAQDALVHALVDAGAHDGWQRIFADMEILEFEEGYDIDSVMFTIVRSAAGALSDPQFSMLAPIREAVVALYRAMADGPRKIIGGFELTIDADGAYRFVFNHGQSQRLNGKWDQARQSWIDDYLTRYQREIGEI